LVATDAIGQPAPSVIAHVAAIDAIRESEIATNCAMKPDQPKDERCACYVSHPRTSIETCPRANIVMIEIEK
jgi:hypothetical protein